MTNSIPNAVILAADLKKAISDIVNTSGKGTVADGAWLSNIDRLCQRILVSDPSDFLKWDMIARTMVVGNAEFVPEELAFLQALSDWKSRWENSITESSVGAPDMFPGFPSSSGNLIHLAYHLAHFEQRTRERISDAGFVVEFGGGYGSMCRLVRNLGFKGQYVIFDLPPLSALQRYFLKMNGVRAVATAEEALKSSGSVACISGLDELRRLVAALTKPGNSAFIATWSLSESPVELRREILPLLTEFRHFLIAYQGLFGEVDNDVFFRSWAESMKSVSWYNWKIPHLPNRRYKDNYYLMGKALG